MAEGGSPMDHGLDENTPTVTDSNTDAVNSGECIQQSSETITSDEVTNQSQKQNIDNSKSAAQKCVEPDVRHAATHSKTAENSTNAALSSKAQVQQNLIQMTKSLSAKDKAKVAEMVKGLAKFKLAEEDVPDVEMRSEKKGKTDKKGKKSPVKVVTETKDEDAWEDVNSDDEICAANKVSFTENVDLHVHAGDDRRTVIADEPKPKKSPKVGSYTQLLQSVGGRKPDYSVDSHQSKKTAARDKHDMTDGNQPAKSPTKEKHSKSLREAEKVKKADLAQHEADGLHSHDKMADVSGMPVKMSHKQRSKLRSEMHKLRKQQNQSPQSLNQSDQSKNQSPQAQNQSDQSKNQSHQTQSQSGQSKHQSPQTQDQSGQSQRWYSQPPLSVENFNFQEMFDAGKIKGAVFTRSSSEKDATEVNSAMFGVLPKEMPSKGKESPESKGKKSKGKKKQAQEERSIENSPKEAVGLPRAEPLRTDVSEVRVHVQKSDHRFIVGQQRRNIEEIYNLTGVRIEVPGMNDPSEEIVLHGDRFQIGSAITLMYTKNPIFLKDQNKEKISTLYRCTGRIGFKPKCEVSRAVSEQKQKEKEVQKYQPPQSREFVGTVRGQGQVKSAPISKSDFQYQFQGQGQFNQGQGTQGQAQFCQGTQGQGQIYQGQGSQGQGQFYQSQGAQGQGQRSQVEGQRRTSQGQGQQNQKKKSGGGQVQQNQKGKGQGQGKNAQGDRNSAEGQRQVTRGQKKNQPQKDIQKKKVFEPYMTSVEVSRGLKRGVLIEGPIRINPKNFEEAYVPHPSAKRKSGTASVNTTSQWSKQEACIACATQVWLTVNHNTSVTSGERIQSLKRFAQDGKSDILICSFTDRNRALNGDVVAVWVKQEGDWKLSKEELQHLEDTHGDKEELQQGDNSENADEADVKIESEEVIVKEGNCDNDSGLGTAGNVDSRKVTNTVESSKGSSAEPASQTPKTDQRRGGNPSMHRYTSLSDVLNDGSPVAQKLFSSTGSREGTDMVEKARKLLVRTGKVVALIEKKHSRACTGTIKPLQDKNPNRALFAPSDNRVPRLLIPMSDCPKGLLERPEDFARTLYVARMTDWKDDSKMALGKLARSLGEAGEIEPETEGMLIENGVDFDEFPEQALDCLPKNLPWRIPETEFEYRRDLRDSCIFSIDPATARDLDDALSCEDLGNGRYKVGVHIADVSWFINEGSVLDRVASLRATSVYLVHKVIPMLPRLLCEQLCSLNPDEDRLAFSVEWIISESGEIEEELFGRSVIRSCVKLSYDHAQGFIEQPDREWTQEELPSISEKYTVDDIKTRVLNLHKIARNLRKARFDGGCLKLDQVKLQYSLDFETGLPNGYWVYKQKESNSLVEEFMLLANMAVAHRINNFYPDKALLRRHPPPQEKMLENLKEQCSALGLHIDTSGAGELQRSLWRYFDDDEYSLARTQVLVSLCSKPMQNAKYFCTGCIDDESLYHHYALNVPLYTHFTSPIRRYPDVIVHRLLGATLDYCDEPHQSPQELHKMAEHCNDKKTAAKRCSDLSSELFFAVFVKVAGPLEEKAMVMAVFDKAFDIFILRLGVTKRVYCDKLDIKEKHYAKDKKVASLTLIWKAEEGESEQRQVITIFTVVDCVLKEGELPLQWSAVIKRPQTMNLINQLVGQEQESPVSEDESSDQEELPAENMETVKMDLVENDQVDVSGKGVPAEKDDSKEILPANTESVKRDIVENASDQEELLPENMETIKMDIVEDPSNQEEVQ